MYLSVNTAERIKLIAKSKNIIVKDMLEKCELNKNVLSTMISRGSWVQANNLAKIADYLDCSVDYLLGRTDNPDSHKSKTKNIPLPPLELAAYGAEGTEGTYTPPTEEIT